MGAAPMARLRSLPMWLAFAHVVVTCALQAAITWWVSVASIDRPMPAALNACRAAIYKLDLPVIALLDRVDAFHRSYAGGLAQVIAFYVVGAAYWYLVGLLLVVGVRVLRRWRGVAARP
jgi:hypothetical protein